MSSNDAMNLILTRASERINKNLLNDLTDIFAGKLVDDYDNFQFTIQMFVEELTKYIHKKLTTSSKIYFDDPSLAKTITNTLILQSGFTTNYVLYLEIQKRLKRLE